MLEDMMITIFNDDIGINQDVIEVDDVVKLLKQIKTEIYNLHPIKRGDNDYANGAYDGQCWIIDKALKIIDKHTKRDKEI